MDAQDVLIQARERIEKKGWCQGAVAKDSDGEEVGAKDPKAVAYCIIGAVQAVTPPTTPDLEDSAFVSLEDWLPSVAGDNYMGLAFFNDRPRTTKADVVAVFDRAIAAEGS